MSTNRSLPSALYPRLIGASWHNLDEAVRRVHAEAVVVRAAGSFRIQHGSNWLARFLLRLWRMPPATEAVDTRLVITPQGHGEQWRRAFGSKFFVTTQQELASSLLGEQVGILEFQFRLEVAGGALIYRQRGAALRLGSLYVPLPRWMSPQVVAREEPSGSPNQTHVLVAVTAPLVGLLISYEGQIKREEVP